MTPCVSMTVAFAGIFTFVPTATIFVLLDQDRPVFDDAVGRDQGAAQGESVGRGLR